MKPFSIMAVFKTHWNFVNVKDRIFPYTEFHHMQL